MYAIFLSLFCHVVYVTSCKTIVFNRLLPGNFFLSHYYRESDTPLSVNHVHFKPFSFSLEKEDKSMFCVHRIFLFTDMKCSLQFRTSTRVWNHQNWWPKEEEIGRQWARSQSLLDRGHGISVVWDSRKPTTPNCTMFGRI